MSRVRGSRQVAAQGSSAGHYAEPNSQRHTGRNHLPVMDDLPSRERDRVVELLTDVLAEYQLCLEQLSVLDLTVPDPDRVPDSGLRVSDAAPFDCLVIRTPPELGALAPALLRQAFNHVSDNGWVALGTDDGYSWATSGGDYGDFIRSLVVGGLVRLEAWRRYRTGATGACGALVGKKLRAMLADDVATAPGHVAHCDTGAVVCAPREAPERITFGSITFDLLTESVFSGRETIALTKHQRRLLKRLALTPNGVVSPQELASFAGIQPSKKHQNLHNEIWRLRGRLGPAAARFVRNVRGLGYRLVQSSKE